MKKYIWILIIVIITCTGCTKPKAEKKYVKNTIEEVVDFNKAHVNYINATQNYMEIQTWDFKTILINFLDNYLEQSNENLKFSEGDYVNIINIKEERYENGNIFYFADKNTTIEKCSNVVKENKTKYYDEDNYEEEDKPLVDEVLEEKKDDYNYGKR